MRILIVDDSALVRNILKQVLTAAPPDKIHGRFEVIAEAANGERAVAVALSLKPDLIIMDINMPILDGIQATGQIRKHADIPVLVFSSEADAHKSFQVVKQGAVDLMKKPDLDQLNSATFLEAFTQKLVALANFRSRPLENARPNFPQPKVSVKPAMVVIGASTGGPVAVRYLLSCLPLDFSVPVAIVQHLEDGFDEGYARWLSESCALPVVLATHGMAASPGKISIAPCSRHLSFEGSQLALSDGPKVLNQKPSVDVLFQSAALVWGRQALGVLLTGMGRDGALGCKAIRDAGGTTFVQDESTSAIFGMPKAAIELEAASVVLPLQEIVPAILRTLGKS